jgi:membrane peptidoglycan carboxypeptidase
MRSSSPGLARSLTLLSAFVVASLITGALVAGLFIPAVGATGVVTRSGVDYFNSLPADLSRPPLAEQSTMYAGDGKTVIARFYDENRINVPLAKIAPVMRQAVVAIEDSRFYEHGGVDPKGVLRAFLNNQMSGETQGASTLTQQYIKNYNVEKALATGDAAAARAAVSQNYSRKLQEMRTAIALEKQLTKDQILEGYLNIALFGDNTWGVEAASQYFFGISASSLSLVQAATLAGLVQSPTSYNPFQHPDHAVTRRNEVLTRMLQLGMITQPQFDAAKATKLVTKRTVAQNGCITAGNAAYFCDYVINTIRTDPSFAFLGKTGTERMTNLKRGGYSLVTSLDPKVQNTAYATAVDHVPVKDPSKVAAAAVTVQPGTGRVLAIAQNRIYNPDGKTGDTTLNYGVDKLVGNSNGFATGSTFKAFTLAQYLSDGNSLNDFVDASKSTRPMSDFTACGSKLGGTPYHFSNSEGNMSGSIPVLEATYDSVNTAFVDIESRVDMCDLAITASKLGVHLASAPSIKCDNATWHNVTLDYKKDPLLVPDCGPALTLGPNSISPLTMAAAYAAFAADGKYCEPRPVIAMKDRTGKALPVPAVKCSQGVSSDVAHGVTYALKRVLTQGTAGGKGLNVPSAGKTGTSDQSGNGWFVGYTSSLSTAVWVADPNTYPKSVTSLGSGQRPLTNIRINGHYWSVVFGADIAGAIWHDLMSKAVNGRNNNDWPSPPGSMLKSSGVQVPDVTGQPIQQAQAILSQAGFQVNVGGMTAGPPPAGSVASTSPAAGSTVAPNSTITINVSDGSQGGNGNGHGHGGLPGLPGLPILPPNPTG